MKAFKLLGVALATAGLVGLITPDALANSGKGKGNGNGNAAPTTTPPAGNSKGNGNSNGNAAPTTTPPAGNSNGSGNAATTTTPPATTPTTTSPTTTTTTTSPTTTSSQPTSTFACSGGSVTSNPLAGGSSLSYSQCMTSSGNDVNSSIATNLTAFLDSTLGDGWVFDGKYEGGRNSSGPNDYGFSWVQTGKGTGSWSLAETITSPFVISLKAGNAYTAYYFDSSASFNGGSWATFDKKDLSHASIFVAKGNLTPEEPNTTVPEPASTAALVLVGLSAAGLARKNKKQG